MDRRAYLAGLWYPGDRESCAREIEARAQGTDPAPGQYHGLIGPHAGWAYSGDCAAHTYGWLARDRSDAELVVIFGSHRGPNGPSTVFRGHGWETPVGTLETDGELAERIAGELGLADEPVQPARPDNAVELHLPFVKHFFPRARFVMMGVAASEIALEIGRRTGELARDRGAVFVGSTDLTHYGPNYDYAPAGSGAGAVRAAYGSVSPVLVEHYLSYDVRPDASFVGYAGLVI